MKSYIDVENVYEDEVTAIDFPVYLTGYDEYSGQQFNGKFNYSSGKLKPIEYSVNKGLKLSQKFAVAAGLKLCRYREQYEATKKNQ